MRTAEKVSPPAFDGTPEDPGKFLRSLGLCRAAGKIVSGTPAVCEALRAAGNGATNGNTVFAVFAAADISDNTRKKLSDKARTYGALLRVLPVKSEELARAVGKTGQVAAVAVSDANLLRMLSGTWNENGNSEN